MGPVLLFLLIVVGAPVVCALALSSSGRRPTQPGVESTPTKGADRFSGLDGSQLAPPVGRWDV